MLKKKGVVAVGGSQETAIGGGRKDPFFAGREGDWMREGRGSCAKGAVFTDSGEYNVL